MVGNFSTFKRSLMLGPGGDNLINVKTLSPPGHSMRDVIKSR